MRTSCAAGRRRDLAERRRERVDDGIDLPGRDERAGGSRCTSGPALTVISLTSSRRTGRIRAARPGVGAEDRAVERVGLGVEPHRAGDQLRCDRSRAAVHAEPVKPTSILLGQLVSRSPAPPQTSCSAPSGSSPDPTISSTQPRGEVSRLRRGLDQGRDARDQGRGQLLQRPPHREVEGVDLHRDAVQRAEQVLADELARLGRAAPPPLDVARGSSGSSRLALLA